MQTSGTKEVSARNEKEMATQNNPKTGCVAATELRTQQEGRMQRKATERLAGRNGWRA